MNMLACPRCGKSLQRDLALSGKVALCPHCHRPISFPALSGGPPPRRAGLPIVRSDQKLTPSRIEEIWKERPTAVLAAGGVSLAILMVFLVALFAAASSGNRQVAVPRERHSPYTPQQSVAPVPTQSTSGAETLPVLPRGGSDTLPSLPDVIDRVRLSVVRVDVVTLEGRSHGSGFVVGVDGQIATNFHVMDGAIHASVRFSDDTEEDIVGYLDLVPEKDLALIQIRTIGRRLQPLTLAATLPRQGERVYAYGSPIGLDGSATDGIVSAVRSSRRSADPTLIQMTTPISPGNSGGPLFNERGEVVGISTFKLVPPNSESLNFAVSANDLRDVMRRSNGLVQDLRAMPK